MYARVQLIGSESFAAPRRPSFKKGQVRYLTNAADIKYFQAQSGFRVETMDVEQAKRTAVRDSKHFGKVEFQTPPPPESKPAPAPASAPASAPAGDAPPELPPWNTGMSVKKLLKAAKARNIAVSDDDKKADLIELLRMYDEDNKSASGESQGDEDEDDEDDNEGGED